MNKIDKQEYQKRSLAIQKLYELLESNPSIPIGEIISTIFSPIGESKHPFSWTDNETLGKIESAPSLLKVD